MSEDATVRFSRLYRMREDLPFEERVILRAAGIRIGDVLWCEGNRPSSLGGHIGNFRDTYLQTNGYSPSHKKYPNMPMRYFVEVSC